MAPDRRSIEKSRKIEDRDHGVSSRCIWAMEIELGANHNEPE